MSIHFTQTGVRWPAAAIYEIARQFWGTRPDFTLIGISMNHPQAVLVHGGLVKKLITSYCGDPYYTPGPNGVYHRAFLEGSVEIENWSIFTLPLRLKAAAMGIPFAVTRSLIGSSMELDNTETFQTVDDPFGSGSRVGLLKALYPDISIIHGWVADKYGNTLLCYPLAENTYGAMASRNGTIVTVEKIVDSEYIRRYAHLNFLPGDYVRSVCVVPFGAHPSGMSRMGLPEFEGYGEDYEFIETARQASKERDHIDRWIREWVLGCEDHGAYLRKLGRDRLTFLKGRSHADSWQVDVYTRDVKHIGGYNNHERMLAAAAIELQKRIRSGGYLTILAGAGMANLSAWLAYQRLTESNYKVELMAEVGLYGYSPRVYDPAGVNHANFYTCKAVSDTHTVMGVYMSGTNNRCVGVVGFGQIDRYGNINTTKIPGKTYIAGSGGANDIASSAMEVVAVGAQGKNRLVEAVPYITSPGKGVRTLITNLGVYEKLHQEGELVLTGYYAGPGIGSKEEAIRHIRESCGWELKVAENLMALPEPDLQDIDLLRLWDPDGYFLAT
jgi:acyl CoA:acetate/3-ketoacid CoA transferase alpha subunit/acyl CoA:acetate/3-ketoacid CoA transferase beta subunit